MQGYWDSGKFVLVSTLQDRLRKYENVLKEILEKAPKNGEDASYLIAKRALEDQE